MTAAGQRAEVLVKVDVGFHRCGIAPDPADGRAVPARRRRAAGAAAGAASSVMPGHAYHAHSDDELAAHGHRRTRPDGRPSPAPPAAPASPLREVSAGATPPARYSLRGGAAAPSPSSVPATTSTSIARWSGLGAATRDDCALTVLATVVSAPAPDRRRARLRQQDARRRRRPRLHRRRRATATMLPRARAGGRASSPIRTCLWSDSRRNMRRCASRPAPRPLGPGDRVRVLPNHACVVSNLVDQAWLVRRRDGGRRAADCGARHGFSSAMARQKGPDVSDTPGTSATRSAWWRPAASSAWSRPPTRC